MNVHIQDVVKNYLGVIGSVLLIISEFLPWLENNILFMLYVIKISTAIEDAFLYLFPIISGVICLGANIWFIYNRRYKIKAIIVDILGLSFLLIFLFELIPSNFPQLFIGIGIYICILALILIVIDLIQKLKFGE